MRVPKMNENVHMRMHLIAMESRSAQDFVLRLKEEFPNAIVQYEKVYDNAGQLKFMLADVILKGVTYGMTFEPGSRAYDSGDDGDAARKVRALAEKLKGK